MNNEKFTITVSAGMQIASIEQIDNTVVVLVEGAKTEPEKADFKDGDIIYQWVSDVNKSMLIILRNDYTFREGEDNIPSYAIVNLKGDLTINKIFGTFDVTEFRLATENEKTILFDALAKDGKQWNLEKKCIEPLIHIPKEGDFVRFTYKDGVGYFICGKFRDGVVHQKKETAMIDAKGEISHKTSQHITFPFNKKCIFETITKDEFCKSLNDLGYEYNFETNEIEPFKWQPKEGDEVHNVLFGVNSNRFYIHSFIWSMSRELTDCMKQSKENAQQLCDKLNAALYEK